MNCYVDFKRMQALSPNELSRVKIGDKFYYVNSGDELNTHDYDINGKEHHCKVVYEAEVVQTTKYLIIMNCTAIPATIIGWEISGDIKPHVESMSKYDACEMSKQWLYKNIAWEFIEEEEENDI